VPENVAKFPDDKRRQWAQVWNSAFEKCEKDGGEDCESSAFAQANSVIEKSVLTVYKSVDGTTRWASISSMAVRDKEFETVSESAYDDAIKFARESGNFGELDLVHVAGTDVGDCDFMLRSGNQLVEGGTWRGTPMALGAMKAVSETPDRWGVSLRFQYDPTKFVNGVYEGNIRVIKRTILPVEMAASYGTRFIRLGGETVKEIRERAKEALGALGVEPGTIAELAEKQAEPPVNEKSKEASVWQRLVDAAKSIFEPQDHEPDVVEAVEEPTAQEVQPDNGEAIKAIGEVVAAQVQQLFEVQQKTIDGIAAQVGELQYRLEEAEKALEDKVIERLKELPRVVKVKATEVETAPTPQASRNKLLDDIANAVQQQGRRFSV